MARRVSGARRMCPMRMLAGFVFLMLVGLHVEETLAAVFGLKR